MKKLATFFDATYPVDETHQVNIYREESTGKKLFVPSFFAHGSWQPYRNNGRVYVARSLVAATRKIAAR